MSLYDTLKNVGSGLGRPGGAELLSGLSAALLAAGAGGGPVRSRWGAAAPYVANIAPSMRRARQGALQTELMRGQLEANKLKAKRAAALQQKRDWLVSDLRNVGAGSWTDPNTGEAHVIKDKYSHLSPQQRSAAAVAIESGQTGLASVLAPKGSYKERTIDLPDGMQQKQISRDGGANWTNMPGSVATPKFKPTKGSYKERTIDLPDGMQQKQISRDGGANWTNMPGSVATPKFKPTGGVTSAQTAENIDTGTARNVFKDLFKKNSLPGETPREYEKRVGMKVDESGYEKNEYFDQRIKGIAAKANERMVGEDPKYKEYQKWLDTPNKKKGEAEPMPLTSSTLGFGGGEIDYARLKKGDRKTYTPKSGPQKGQTLILVYQGNKKFEIEK